MTMTETEARYELVDDWNGGTHTRRVCLADCTPDEAFHWILDNTPYSWDQAVRRQGYMLRKLSPDDDEEGDN